MVKYIPEQGNIVTLNFDPQSGHEQKGRRPALIFSNKIFNKHLGLAFHVEVNSENITGFVMSEQMKSIDYTSRKIKFIEKADEAILNRILSIVDSILK